MAKSKTVYVCTECGNETLKWQGRCPACGALEYDHGVYAPARVARPEPGDDKSDEPRPSGPLAGNLHPGNSRHDGYAGAGPGPGRRRRGGVAGAVQRRAGHRQAQPCCCKSAASFAGSVRFSTAPVRRVSSSSSCGPTASRSTQTGCSSCPRRRLIRLSPAQRNINQIYLIVDSIQTLYAESNTATSGSVSQAQGLHDAAAAAVQDERG